MQNIIFTSKKAGLPFRKTVFYKKGYFINCFSHLDAFSFLGITVAGGIFVSVK